MRFEKLLLFIFSISLAGCDLINPAEPIPARIELKPFELQVQTGQGSARQEITEVWVFANQNFLGVFSPPVEIPFLSDNAQTTFEFRPGIRNNGIAEDAIIYPLYTTYEISLPTGADAVSTVNPLTHYQPHAVISLNATFETNNEFTDNRDSIAASFVGRTMNDAFEGSYSGEIIMSEEAYWIEVGNSLAMGNLPTDGKPTYLEFQYKSEIEFSIGLLGISLDGNSFSNFFYLVRPSDHWNMLYIELTDLLKNSDFPGYKILFRSLYPANAAKPEYKILLDNVKVVHL